jgi:hypothetical protein
MYIDKATAKEAVRLLKNYRELIETSKALAEIFDRIRAKCADMAKDEKDANGREHAPAGSPNGGQFIGEGGNGSGTSSGGAGGTVTTPEERRKKIESVKISFDRDNILPELNKEDLAEIGKTESKPVLLKKNIIDRNEFQHPDIARHEYDLMIGETLYNKNAVIKENSPEKPAYYHFIKYLPKNNSVVLLDMSEDKNNYEIVHIQIMRDKNVRRLKEKNS